jgi:hypothetical protein
MALAAASHLRIVGLPLAISAAITALSTGSRLMEDSAWD